MSERELMVAGNCRTRAMLDRYVRRDDDTLRIALGRVGNVVLGTFGDATAKSGQSAATMAQGANGGPKAS